MLVSSTHMMGTCINLCPCVVASRRHNNVQHKTVPPSVTLRKLHAFANIMQMLVRARLHAQCIGITAFMSHACQTAQT